MILLLVLLLVATLFHPYLEMQAQWYWLLFRHWYFQTYSDIVLAQARNYLAKSDICIRLGDTTGAEKMNALSQAKMVKVAAEREKVEAILQRFSEKYI